MKKKPKDPNADVEMEEQDVKEEKKRKFWHKDEEYETLAERPSPYATRIRDGLVFRQASIKGTPFIFPLQENIELVKMICRTMYDHQKQRIAIGNRLGSEAAVRHAKSMKADFAEVLQMEHALEYRYERLMNKALDGIPIWDKWLSRIKGMGPRIGGTLVAGIYDMSRFETVGSLWAYFGMNVINTWHCNTKTCNLKDLMDEDIIALNPLFENETDHNRPMLRGWPLCPTCHQRFQRVGRAPKRKKDEKANWSQELRKTCYNMAASFLKQRHFFFTGQYQIYKERKFNERVTNHVPVWKTVNNKPTLIHVPEGMDAAKIKYVGGVSESMGHLDSMSKRRIVKIFLSMMFEEWNRLEGREFKDPYVFGVLKHEHRFTPDKALENYPTGEFDTSPKKPRAPKESGDAGE